MKRTFIITRVQRTQEQTTVQFEDPTEEELEETECENIEDYALFQFEQQDSEWEFVQFLDDGEEEYDIEEIK